MPPTPTRLLVVDDEECVRTSLGRLLQMRGFAVKTADGAAAALELLTKETFDVMLTDVLMPGMDGVELVPCALALDENLAIVMLSGVGEVTFATQALKLGAFDYLMKPAPTEQVVGALHEAVHRRRLDRERRRVEPAPVSVTPSN